MNRLFIAILSFTGLLVASLATSAADQISGMVASVHDGDTLTLSGGTKVRLFGVDAPELAQKCSEGNACVSCGEASGAALRALVQGKPITCAIRGKSYDRIIGQCQVDGQSVDLAMLKAGEATAYEFFLKEPELSAYLAAQNEAKAAKRGIWAGDLINPYRWRKGDRLACER